MAKRPCADFTNNQYSTVDDDDELVVSVDKKYKEIEDKGNGQGDRISYLHSPSSNDIKRCMGSVNGELDEDEAIQRRNVTCPTCRGSGVIQTDDSSLVALIPVKDERLMPKRIKLKVALSVFITLVLCGITVFFLFPRSPTLELLSVISRNVRFLGNDSYIVIKGEYRVKNDNFVSVKLTSLSVDVTWYDEQVGFKPMKDFHTTAVNGRSSTTFIIYVNTTYSEPRAKKFFSQWCPYQFCETYIRIAIELKTSYLFHDEKVSSSDIRTISCYCNRTVSYRIV